MQRKPTTTPERDRPQEVIRRLLEAPATPAYPVLVERRVATLERQAPQIVDRASNAGVEIEYLGVTELFEEPRLYAGVETDWVLGPARRLDDAVIPSRERKVLERLLTEVHNFPMIYIAHEVKRSDETSSASSSGPRILDRAKAAKLVGPIPPPADAVALSERLGRRSTQVMRAAGRAAVATGAVAAGIAAAPVVLVGGALASLATLDPIVLGAIPALSARPGQPAAFFVLARWDW